MEPIKLDRNQIMAIIPHRDPMLLVDEVTAMIPGESITAKFYVDPARDIFRGHFPGDPVLPGVYTVEIMAQASVIFLCSLERYKGKTPLFIGIDKVKFARKIVPGDTIEIRSKFEAENTAKAICTCSAEVYKNGELASAGTIVVAMR